MSDDVHEPEGEKTDKKGKHHVLVGKLQQSAVKAQIKGQFRHTGKKKEPQGILLTVGGMDKAFHQKKTENGEGNSSY